jgi:hypothetical protein
VQVPVTTVFPRATRAWHLRGRGDLDDPRLALRVSNGLLLALLFAVGYRAGQHAFARPLLVGTVFLLAGVILVAATIALGG